MITISGHAKTAGNSPYLIYHRSLPPLKAVGGPTASNTAKAPRTLNTSIPYPGGIFKNRDRSSASNGCACGEFGDRVLLVRQECARLEKITIRCNLEINEQGKDVMRNVYATDVAYETIR